MKFSSSSKAGEITRIGKPAAVLVAVCALGGGALLASPAEAHHAQAPYFDFSKQIEIEGVVQRFDFRNPHAIMYVEVENEQGETEVWRIQFANATNLRRRGWTPDMIQPGVKIHALGHPSRNPEEHGMNGAEIILPDGTRFGSPRD